MLQIREVQMQNYSADKLSVFNREILHNITIALKSTRGYSAVLQSDESFLWEVLPRSYSQIISW